MGKTSDISRRAFNQTVAAGAAAILAGSGKGFAAMKKSGLTVRLGGPVYVNGKDPGVWAEAHRKAGYGAAYCPVGPEAGDAEVAAFRKAAGDAGLIIAEVGAWSNPVSRDDAVRKQAVMKCVQSLELAERIGAACCVNISGSRGDQWDGPDPDNLTKETFGLIVDTTRSIIDAVKPRSSYFTLEPMPWAYPDSPDSYLRLLKAVDRKKFGAHLDPVNMINSPERYFRNDDFLRECFKKLGPHIKACHAKDILMQPKLTTHLDEVRPGLGALDYPVYLTELGKLGGSVGLMIEHLETEADYRLAAEYIRGRGTEAGVSFV
ncbi:sugar phosphate isomerase/epimerase [bacterium]|nr:sugar phosphate isomerase/epimerase [bacterium]